MVYFKNLGILQGLGKLCTCICHVLGITNVTNCCTWFFSNRYIHKHKPFWVSNLKKISLHILKSSLYVRFLKRRNWNIFNFQFYILHFRFGILLKSLKIIFNGAMYQLNLLCHWITVKKTFDKKVKACIPYFLENFYFSPNDSPSKTTRCFLFHLKSSFHSWDI